jgi:hypothetical protein
MVSKKTKIAILIIIAVVVVSVTIPGIFIGMFIHKEATRPKDSDNPDEKMFTMTDYNLVNSPPTTSEGYLNEGESYRYDYSPPLEDGDLLRLIRVRLTWRDEEDMAEGLTQYDNEPDSFYVMGRWDSPKEDSNTAFIGSGAGKNMYDGEGLAWFEVLINHYSADSINGKGLWNITILMSYAGDHVHPSEKVPPQPDDGNSYQMSIEIEIYKPTS